MKTFTSFSKFHGRKGSTRALLLWNHKPFAVTCAHSTVRKTLGLFHQTALLLGARSSVHHFSWVARVILQLLVSGLRVLSTMLFDDFPTVGTTTERAQLTSCVEALFSVTGWSLKDTASFGPSFSALHVKVDLGEFDAGQVVFGNTDIRISAWLFALNRETAKWSHTRTHPRPHPERKWDRFFDKIQVIFFSKKAVPTLQNLRNTGRMRLRRRVENDHDQKPASGVSHP